MSGALAQAFLCCEPGPVLFSEEGSAEAVAASFAETEDPRVRRPTRLVAIGAVGGADELSSRAIRATTRGEAPDLSRLRSPIFMIYEAVLLRAD